MTQQDNKATASRLMVLGRVSGLYGVRGWVRVFSYTEPRDALLAYQPWLLRVEGSWVETAVAEGRVHGKSVVVKFADSDDRETSAQWIGADIAVTRQRLPALAKGEFYWSDLEGLQVRHRDGRILGTVAKILATGANDVLVVQAATSENQEILIPFVQGMYILHVDVTEGVIDVDWEWD